MKIKELQKYLRQQKIDVALLMNLHSIEANPNLYYFTQYEGNGVLVIPSSSSPLLVVPDMEAERARRTSTIKTIKTWPKKGRLFVEIKKLFGKKRIKTIGVDAASLSLLLSKAIKKGFQGGRFTDIGEYCRCLRAVKTKEEIALIKKAFSITNVIVNSTIKNFKKFKTEQDVATFLRIETIKNGCELSFPPIVASGKNAAMPHYSPQHVPLQNGFCVVDFGIKYNGYCTDITRTVFLGKPSERDIGLYNFILRAQEKSISLIQKGIKTAFLYKQMQKDLRHYARFFTHGLGHGVGLEIHELPNLSLNSKEKIGNNMTFTIEPGIYIPGKFGIRIEDTVLFTNKVDVLTKVSKKLMVIAK